MSSKLSSFKTPAFLRWRISSGAETSRGAPPAGEAPALAAVPDKEAYGAEVGQSMVAMMAAYKLEGTAHHQV